MSKNTAKTKKTRQTAEKASKKPIEGENIDYAVTTAKLSDLIPDDKNFNKGTEFGQHLIEKSLRENGAGRSILLDKNNRIIAGNKTAENAAAIDLNDVVIVETDGTKLVAVKRTDIDLDSEQGRKMALADNATSAANLDWDEDALKAMEQEMDNFSAEEWGIKMTENIANDAINFASSEVATEAFSDDTNYDLSNLYRKRLNETISKEIDAGIKSGEIRERIAEVLKTRAQQCVVFNFDEIIKFYRSKDATDIEKKLLRRLYLVFVTPKELFDEGVLKLKETSNIIFDHELLLSQNGEEDGDDNE